MQGENTATEPLVTIDATQRICINGRIATSEQIAALTESQLSSLSFAQPTPETVTPGTATLVANPETPAAPIRNRRAFFGFRTLIVATACHTVWLAIFGLVSAMSNHFASTFNGAAQSGSFTSTAILPPVLGAMFLVAPAFVLRSQFDSPRAVLVLRLATALAVFDAFLVLWHLITIVVKGSGLLAALASAVISMGLVAISARAALLFHHATKQELA